MINLAKSKRKRRVKELEHRLDDVEMRLAMMEQAEKKKRTAREWLALLPILIRSILDALVK